MAGINVPGLVRHSQTIQELMNLDTVLQASRSRGRRESLVDKVEQSLFAGISRVDRIFSRSDATAADLSRPSRRAYQWMCYLSRSDHLSSHLDALEQILQLLEARRPRKTNPSRKLDFQFYHQSALYRARPERDRSLVTVQQSLVCAPQPVLAGLLEWSLNGSRGSARQLVRDFCLTEEYRRSRETLEYLGIPRNSFSQGRAHDLVASFNRVNQIYFQGGARQPHLVWSPRPTYRKFGHYQWDINTIMVSRSLDAPGIPDLVVDFVIYHELLHMTLGHRQTAQRRMVHTAEFRKAEAEFHHLEQARRWLNRISRKNLA